MFLNLAAVAQTIQIMGMNGDPVSELHMSQYTYESFRQHMKLAGCAMPRKTKRDPTPVLKFNGVALISNPVIPEGGIMPRPMRLMNDQDWINTINKEGRARAAAQPVQFRAQPGKVEFSEHPQSPTDIMISATENLEDTKVVIVVKVKNDGNVVVKGNTSKHEMMGVLQAAVAKLFEPA